MESIEITFAKSFIQEAMKYSFDNSFVDSISEVIQQNERLIQQNRTNMIKDFEYWKAWNKVTDALKGELSAAEKKIGSEAMRNRWNAVGKSISDIDIAKSYNNYVNRPNLVNAEALGKNLGAVVSACEVLATLNKENVSTYEVGGSAVTALGGLLGGMLATAIGVTMLGSAFLGSVALSAGLAIAAGLAWEKWIAPALGIDPKDAPGFWDTFYDNNAWARTLAKAINDLFLPARTAVPRSDPLALDLDGDGLETIGIDIQRPILFDHDGDGIKTATGWIKADGSAGQMGEVTGSLADLNLAHNAFYREFPDRIPLTDEAKGFANLTCR